MASRALGERRQSARHRSARTIRCRPAIDPCGPDQTATVRDVSFGGIGLLVGSGLPPGTLLHLELPPAARSGAGMLACVAHSTGHDSDQWAVGCSFIRELDEQELQSLL